METLDIAGREGVAAEEAVARSAGCGLEPIALEALKTGGLGV